MPQADLDALRAEYAAMSRKDWDGLLSGAHPDFELKTPDRGLALSGVFRGPERARQVFAEFFGPFEAVTVEPQEFFQGDDGRIVVFFLQTSKPEGSTASVEARAAHLWTMRAGKPTRLEIFPRRAEALKAAGLSE